MRLLLPVALALLGFAIACGEDTATSSIIELTIDNASGQAIDVSLDGDDFEVATGQQDTVSLLGDEFRIVIVGIEDGRTLFDDSLTRAEIEDRDNQIIVTNDGAGG
jgi:hypothetical protein